MVDVDRLRTENRAKVMNYNKDKGSKTWCPHHGVEMTVAFCSRGHELAEDEAFLIFGSLKAILSGRPIATP